MEKPDSIELSNIEDLFDKGVDHFNMDLYDTAIAYFTEVLEMNPDHPDALYYRAVARANNKDFDQAVSDFTKALEKNPYDVDSHIGRGQVWESTGRLNRALADFKGALSIDPDSADYQKLVDDLEKEINETSSASS
jgi:tetratricopeptide (TPR) repeat protein